MLAAEQDQIAGGRGYQVLNTTPDAPLQAPLFTLAAERTEEHAHSVDAA